MKQTDLQITGIGASAELPFFVVCATRNVVGDTVYAEHKLMVALYSSSLASKELLLLQPWLALNSIWI